VYVQVVYICTLLRLEVKVNGVKFYYYAEQHRISLFSELLNTAYTDSVVAVLKEGL